MCTAFGTEEQQSVKHGNLYTKWCFIVINSTLHDSHALAVVFFGDESQRLICQLSSIYDQGSKCAQKNRTQIRNETGIP